MSENIQVLNDFQALHISDDDLASLTWYDVQKRLVEAQADHLMCIHKQQLSGLDIYHRILRWKNYLVKHFLFLLVSAENEIWSIPFNDVLIATL